ncbi:hypothetical protein L873DRAFT_1760505 [Choiromyces venosus 120613-1]|uniref:Uncharacterized protein n=1 Tax=Choiromyces venosus 120613-1 TaxID=1336337 RepID=A0A3N4KBW4_9PEZI|nr:hypothetical protein L873DRAFT_1760505 [Choiromyces venosus 120613-1]
MSPLFLRASANSSKLYRSPRAVMMYSYLIAGFSLPFALPVVKKFEGSVGRGGKGEDISLYHCCR